MDDIQAVIEENVDVSRYGLGLPFSFGIVGVGLFALSFPGILSFGAESIYGKIGVLVLVVLSLACVLAAGYTYRAVDTDDWMLTKEEDGPGSGAEDSGKGTDGSE